MYYGEFFLLDREFMKCQDIMQHCIDEGKSNGLLWSQTDSRLLASVILNGLHGSFIRMKTTASVEPLHGFKRVMMNN